MRLVELLVRKHLLAACIGAGLLLGAMIGLFLPIRAAEPPKSEDVAWALPPATVTKRYDDAAFLALRSARFWGALDTPGRRGPAVASYTLNAILSRPSLRVAITESGAPAPKWLVIGDKLPDGSVLVAATRDAIWYERDGCRVRRKLYASAEELAAATDACNKEASGQSVSAAPTAGPSTATPTASRSASSTAPPADPADAAARQTTRPTQ